MTLPCSVVACALSVSVSAAATLVFAQPVQAPDTVTFNRHVAPIIFKRCGSCHHAGGDAPFSLTTYQAARQRATLIAAVTTSRRMPPWRAETDYPGGFSGMEQLSEEEIHTFASWARSGSPEGLHEDLLQPPTYRDGWQLGSPDLVVTFPKPYALRADGRDEYRTFVLPLPVGTGRNVRGLEFRPGVAGGVIHHANILLDRTDRSRVLDDADPAPGYAGSVARSAVNAEGHFIGWVPGMPDPLLPKGLAWRIEAGTDLVVQLHLNPSGKEETIHPLIGLYFTDDEPDSIPRLMRLGRRTIDIAPGEQTYRVTDSYVTPVDIQVTSLKPHAHYLARTVSVTATPPTGVTRRLLSVPSWDFKWQNVYRFTTPVDLPKGSRLSVEFTYDNSERNPANAAHPPQRIRWGPASTDEMADLWVQVRTNDEGDRRVLAREFGRKAAAEEAAGYEGLLEQTPDDPVINDDLALLYMELGKPASAVAHFERSLHVSPGSAAAHFNLATALTAAGQSGQAIGEFESAIRLNPSYLAARNNLGNVLFTLGRSAEAVSQYQQALRADPKYARAHNGLATVLMAQGRLIEARAVLLTAIALEPSLEDTHRNLALVQHAQGAYTEAAKSYQAALRLGPDSPETLSAYAWLLGTSPDNGVRKGAIAVDLATKADGLRMNSDPRALEALAAGFAEEGFFDQALAACDMALRRVGSDSSLRKTLQQQRELYRQGQPVRADDAPAVAQHDNLGQLFA